MVYSSSFKILVSVAVLVTVLFPNAYAQFYESAPDCPSELLTHYSNCRGALQQCSNCLGDAERACEADRKRQGKDKSICYDCTTTFAGRCDSAKPMCFGNQECQSGDSCINFECVYNPS